MWNDLSDRKDGNSSKVVGRGGCFFLFFEETSLSRYTRYRNARGIPAHGRVTFVDDRKPDEEGKGGPRPAGRPGRCRE